MCFRYLKLRFAFLLGFGISFVFTILFSLMEDLYGDKPYGRVQRTFPRRIIPLDLTQYGRKIMANQEKRDAIMEKNVASYKRWSNQENITIYDIDMDRYLYGPKRFQQLESEWLKEKVHVTCVVFVEKLRLARAVKATWGNRCNVLYLFGRHLKDNELPVINVDVKLVSSWQLLCEVMNFVWKHNTTLQWIVFVKDDTVVVPENLRYVVAPLDPTDDYYLGHPVAMWDRVYNTAQAGYVLSKGAFKKIVELFDTSEKCLAGGKYWKKEDYYLGRHLASLGIYPSDTRDEYRRGTFHGYSLQNLLWGMAKVGSYWTHAVYPVSETSCCSAKAITFGAGESDKMYTLDYLLYRLNVFTDGSNFGQRQAPTLIPEEEIWKVALKQEFNISYSNDISNEAYYELWHSKYSEPGELIAKNHRNMSVSLNALIASYANYSSSFNKYNNM